jgi:tRNA pseudouridine38-40 synthase
VPDDFGRRKLTLEFDGRGFSGWQRQAAGERTVQGEIEAALDRLPWRHGRVIGAGRTDAGVHAYAMSAHVDIACDLGDERLRLALNAQLPQDVVAVAVDGVESDFEAQFDCLYRRYLYRMRVVRERPSGLVLDRHRVLPVFRRLDVEAMQAAAERLVGHHDFSSFATQETRSRERTVHLCDLRRHGDELQLHIAADGFLRNMVRTVVGTLLWVGKGRLEPEGLDAILAARDRRRAGPNVAPHALYFVEAGYQPWSFDRSERAWVERSYV